VEFPKPVSVSGLTCLPRQDGQRNGWVKDYAVHVSANGKDWGAPVAQGTFRKDANLHTIQFAAPVSTRFLKLIAVSSFEPPNLMRRWRNCR
jgi:F5/8 type C domain